MSMMIDEMKHDALDGPISILRGITPPQPGPEYFQEVIRKRDQQKEHRESLTRAGVVAMLTLLLALNGWFLSTSGEQETADNREIASYYGQDHAELYNE